MKTVFITGAAGGVGTELAKLFSSEGYRLVLSDRNLAQLQQTADQVQTDYELLEADLRNPKDLAKLCKRIESGENPINVLINNAGIIVPSAVGSLSDDLVRAHIDINLTAPMLLCSAAARAMKQRKSGHILSVVSLAAMAPMKNSAAYASSKFGLRGFLGSLAMELHPYGIGVSAVYPSAIDTPMLSAEMSSPDGSPLNFVGNAKPMLPKEVAAQLLKAMNNGKLETWLPKSDGILAGIMMLMPRFLRPVAGYLEKQGEKKKQEYLANLDRS